ncbi:sensor histidine kinase [Rheinheimera nanhaiensis]|uniref:histidine kinase n=1 Tax=Rheinheimera nanhaiensis E407-8 TaxID=562729 RepID=I1DV10_9GAMM|nr:GAF domain-containing sensor histidine kinase [Rheinheimera nanhaiensis]GAB57888.1 sensor histidine kinase [Rheinheimera nanhaiensis E407-8]
MRTKLQDILTRISKNADIDKGELLSANSLILTGITEGLAVDRASVWFLSDDHQVMQCSYLLDNGELSDSQLQLARQQFPRYFQALDEERNIIAHNAHQHPQTSEFSACYLTPLGIQSMLDTPIRHHGAMVGIICIEHRQPKQWQLDEVVFAGFLADIYGRALSASERQRYQAELEQVNSSLEQIISQRTQELTQSLEQLQQAQHRLIEVEKMASLGRLVAGIAHEINTPLGVAVTANSHAEATLRQLEQLFQAGQLTRQQFSQSGAAIKNSIAMVNTNLQRTVDLVNSFKQTATDSSDQRPEAITLSQFIPKVVASMASMLQQYQVEVVLQVPKQLVVESFASALATILNRLLENACLHAFNSTHHRQVLISASSTAYSWQLSVADNGRGMDQHELNRAFEPFFTTRRSQGAKGLGLTLVFNLVTHLLQGEVQLQNGSSGCTVTISGPLSLSATA